MKTIINSYIFELLLLAWIVSQAAAEVIDAFGDPLPQKYHKMPNGIKLPWGKQLTAEEMDRTDRTYRGMQTQKLWRSFMAIHQLQMAKSNLCMTTPMKSRMNSTDFSIAYNGDLKKDIQNCSKSKANFIVTPLLFYSGDSGHAQMLFYNKTTNTLERYDPNGIVFYNSGGHKVLEDKYQQDKFDESLAHLVGIHVNHHNGYPIQRTQSSEALNYKGFCEAYAYWYLEARLLNPNVSQRELNIAIHQHLVHKGTSSIIEWLAYKIDAYKNLVYPKNAMALWLENTLYHIGTEGVSCFKNILQFELCGTLGKRSMLVPLAIFLDFVTSKLLDDHVPPQNLLIVSDHQRPVYSAIATQQQIYPPKLGSWKFTGHRKDVKGTLTKQNNFWRTITHAINEVDKTSDLSKYLNRRSSLAKALCREAGCEYIDSEDESEASMTSSESEDGYESSMNSDSEDDLE